MPKMRIGLATGPVLLRMGDVFGTTVNRASRLTAMAKPGSTYVDSATLDELEHLEQFSFRAFALDPARGFRLLRAWSMAARQHVLTARSGRSLPAMRRLRRDLNPPAKARVHKGSIHAEPSSSQRTTPSRSPPVAPLDIRRRTLLGASCSLVTESALVDAGSFVEDGQLANVMAGDLPTTVSSPGPP